MDTLQLYKLWLSLSHTASEFCYEFGITRADLDNICSKHENDYTLEEPQYYGDDDSWAV